MNELTIHIEKFDNTFVLFNKDYINVSSKMNEIATILKDLNFNGNIVIDLLTSNGFSKNRFIEIDFLNGSFLRQQAKPYTPTIDFIKKCNHFAREFNLKNSILSENAIHDFLENRADFIDSHNHANYFQIIQNAIKHFDFNFDIMILKSMLVAMENVSVEQEMIEYDIIEQFFSTCNKTIDQDEKEVSLEYGRYTGRTSSSFWRNELIPFLIEDAKRYNTL